MKKLLKTRDRQRYDDDGISILTELAIGIFIIALMSAGTYGVYLWLFSGAQDSSARTNLNTARINAESIYNRLQSGGVQNFCTRGADEPCYKTPIQDANVDNHVADLFNDAGEQLDFCTYADTKTTTPNSGTPAACDPEIWDWDNNTIWVDVNHADFSHNGLTIRKGKMIRLGVRSASGATYCMVIVKDASDNDYVGTGYQATNEEDSEEHPVAGAVNKGWADCGAEYHTSTASGDQDRIKKSLPNQDKVDEEFVDPKSEGDYTA